MKNTIKAGILALLIGSTGAVADKTACSALTDAMKIDLRNGLAVWCATDANQVLFDIYRFALWDATNKEYVEVMEGYVPTPAKFNGAGNAGAAIGSLLSGVSGADLVLDGQTERVFHGISPLVHSDFKYDLDETLLTAHLVAQSDDAPGGPVNPLDYVVDTTGHPELVTFKMEEDQGGLPEDGKAFMSRCQAGTDLMPVGIGIGIGGGGGGDSCISNFTVAGVTGLNRIVDTNMGQFTVGPNWTVTLHFNFNASKAIEVQLQQRVGGAGAHDLKVMAIQPGNMDVNITLAENVKVAS